MKAVVSIATAATAALLGAAPLIAQAPRDVVARGVAAMGGEPALRGIRALSCWLDAMR